jgi:hypothetical protein
LTQVRRHSRLLACAKSESTRYFIFLLLSFDEEESIVHPSNAMPMPKTADIYEYAGDTSNAYLTLLTLSFCTLLQCHCGGSRIGQCLLELLDVVFSVAGDDAYTSHVMVHTLDSSGGGPIIIEKLSVYSAIKVSSSLSGNYLRGFVNIRHFTKRLNMVASLMDNLPPLVSCEPRWRVVL